CRRGADDLEDSLVERASRAAGPARALHGTRRKTALRRIPVVREVRAEGVLHPHRDPLLDPEAVRLDELDLELHLAVVRAPGLPLQAHASGLEQVARVADAVPIEVVLVGVGRGRAVVARGADAIAVEVALVGIGDGRAVVTGITDAVAVGILLPR